MSSKVEITIKKQSPYHWPSIEAVNAGMMSCIFNSLHPVYIMSFPMYVHAIFYDSKYHVCFYIYIYIYTLSYIDGIDM